MIGWLVDASEGVSGTGFGTAPTVGGYLRVEELEGATVGEVSAAASAEIGTAMG